MARKQRLDERIALGDRGGRGSPVAMDYTASGFPDQGDEAEEVPPPIISKGAVNNVKLSGERVLEAPKLKLIIGQVGKEEDGTMINTLSETNSPGDCTVTVAASPLKMYNLLILACEHVRLPVGHVAKIGGAGLGVSRAAGHTIKVMSEPLRDCTMCLPLVFLFAILLSSRQVYSVTHDKSFNEGTCRYDMISLAVFSCMNPDKSWNSPSVSCCKALLHAIDDLPASGENGECCLCRFIRARLESPELATTYISCHGRDRALVARWSFPVKVCGKACLPRKIAPPHKETTMERPPSHSHAHVSNTSRILFIWFAVFFIVLVIFISYLWLVRRTAQGQHESLPLSNNQTQGRRSSLGGDRRRTSEGLKERRASGQRNPNT